MPRDQTRPSVPQLDNALAGYEVMAMVRKGQVRRIGGRDIRAQATFVAELFDVAA
jgi:hypothetical protein